MANNEETSCRPLALLAIVVALVVFVFPLCLRFPLMDPDEGLHASIAQEMVERGDWITPRFLGQPFFDKPILYFWIQAASLRLFGANELAVRLPGLMFGLLGAATTGLLAWRMFGRKTGWIAGIFYATTIMPTALAQAASHDVALVPWVNLAILLLWESDCGKRMRRGTAQPVGRMSEHYVAGSCGQPSPPAPLPPTGEGSCEVGVRRRLLQVGGCTIGAGVFLGLSILTKGLLGVAVVGLAYGGYRLITWRARPAVLLQGAIVLFVAGLIAAPWYLAVAARQPHFLRYYFFERHVLGFATGTQPHSDQPWWYYLPILLGGGLPWIAYVRWAGSGTQKAEGGGRRAEGGGRRAEGGGRKAEGERRAEGGRRKAEGGTPPTLPRAETAGPSALRPPPSALAFLWFWLIGWVVFVTMAQSKLATYLWPAFPPLAILAAVAWTRLIEGSLTEAARRSFARTFVSSSWAGQSCCRRRWPCCNRFWRLDSVGRSGRPSCWWPQRRRCRCSRGVQAGGRRAWRRRRSHWPRSSSW